MTIDSDPPRYELDIDRVIADAEAENGAIDTTQPTYADRVEIGYKAFEIGLWELSRDNHAKARHWFRTAVDFGVEDARSLLSIAGGDALASSPIHPVTTDSSAQASASHDDVPDLDAELVHNAPRGTYPTPRAIPDLSADSWSVSSALEAFSLDFIARPAHERDAVGQWFPRRQLGILRSTAQFTILARDLAGVLARSRWINNDRVVARDTGDHTLASMRTDELLDELIDAHRRAVDLKRALDRDRDHANEFAIARNRTNELVRDLAHICALARDRAVIRDRAFAHAHGAVPDNGGDKSGEVVHDCNFDHALDHALAPVRDSALVHDLAQLRENAFVRARDRALQGAIDPAHVRELVLVRAREFILEPGRVHGPDASDDLGQAVVREIERDVANTLALALAGALDHDRAVAPDHEMFDRELIGAVDRLEEALRPPRPKLRPPRPKHSRAG